MSRSQVILIAAVLAMLGASALPTGQSGGGSSQPAASIRPGTFKNDEFVIVVTAGRDGVFTVTGHRLVGGREMGITGNVSRSGALRASLLIRGTSPETVPINGRYQAREDALFIQSINGEPAGILLKRMGGKGIQEGTYSAREASPNGSWEVKITKSSGPDYNLVGTQEIGGKKTPLAGTLKEDGRVIGRAGSEGQLSLTGRYDFGDNTIELVASVPGATAGLSAVLKHGPLKPSQTNASGSFGLVSKVVGNVPGPVEANDLTISGEVTERSFSIKVVMKPPYQGEASIKHEFSSPLGSTLRPGEEIELTVISSAEKSGSYQPTVAGTGYWLVEGDGAKVLQQGKVFIGSASDGKFYASGQATTKFQVLAKGTIKITAGYAGQYWGPAGNFNWNPCTYTYKFGEKPSAGRS